MIVIRVFVDVGSYVDFEGGFDDWTTWRFSTLAKDEFSQGGAFGEFVPGVGQFGRDTEHPTFVGGVVDVDIPVTIGCYFVFVVSVFGHGERRKCLACFATEEYGFMFMFMFWFGLFRQCCHGKLI
jgi:hypothetical protein